MLAKRNILGHRKNQVLIAARGRVPKQPDVGAVAAAETILERKCDGSFDDFLRFPERGLSIVRVNEIDVRPRQQLFSGNSQGLHPRGIQTFEVSIETRDTKKIQRKLEELIQLAFEQVALAHRRRKIADVAPQLEFRHHQPAQSLQGFELLR